MLAIDSGRNARALLDVSVEHDDPMPWREHEEQPNSGRQPSRLEESIAEFCLFFLSSLRSAFSVFWRSAAGRNARALLDVSVEHDDPMPWREHEEQPNSGRQPSRLEESIAERLGDRQPKLVAVLLEHFHQGLSFRGDVVGHSIQKLLECRPPRGVKRVNSPPHTLGVCLLRYICQGQRFADRPPGGPRTGISVLGAGSNPIAFLVGDPVVD